MPEKGLFCALHVCIAPKNAFYGASHVCFALSNAFFGVSHGCDGVGKGFWGQSVGGQKLSNIITASPTREKASMESQMTTNRLSGVMYSHGSKECVTLQPAA